jgi:hypothetical protein
MESKDELAYVDIFFIQYPLSFVTKIAWDLSKVINEILVANVVRN